MPPQMPGMPLLATSWLVVLLLNNSPLSHLFNRSNSSERLSSPRSKLFNPSWLVRSPVCFWKWRTRSWSILLRMMLLSGQKLTKLLLFTTNTSRTTRAKRLLSLETPRRRRPRRRLNCPLSSILALCINDSPSNYDSFPVLSICSGIGPPEKFCALCLWRRDFDFRLLCLYWCGWLLLHFPYH